MQSAMARSFFRRIAVFLGALFAVFVAALVALGLVEGRLRRAIVAEETAEQGRRFDGAFRLAGAPLAMFTEAYGRRVSFTRPRAVLDAASPRTVLAAGVRTFGADFAWVVEADDTLRYHAARDGQTQMPLPPLPPVAVREPRLHYFFVHEGVLHELRGRRIDADRRSPEDQPGWLLAARRLDAAAFSEPALPIDGEVAILPADAPPPGSSTQIIQFDRVVAGFDGAPVRRLRLTCASHELASIIAGRNGRLLVMVIFAVLSLALLALCLWRWVIRPARIMHRSLAADDAAPLQPLLAAGGDHGRLAQLVRDLIESRGRLRRALAERAQLERDLHDGAIQNIYASGMALAQVRARLPADPAAAGRALGEIHESLNHTIRELRGLMEGLAPEESGAPLTFAAAVAAILAQAAASDPALRTEVEIDAALPARLPIAVRAQMLRFLREAVSNATRHARASRLRFVLRSGDDGDVRLEFTDDGAGFDPARVVPGRGLRNFAERAAELGGELAIESAPGSGTRIRLTLPPAVATAAE